MRDIVPASVFVARAVYNISSDLSRTAVPVDWNETLSVLRFRLIFTNFIVEPLSVSIGEFNSFKISEEVTVSEMDSTDSFLAGNFVGALDSMSCFHCLIIILLLAAISASLCFLNLFTIFPISVFYTEGKQTEESDKKIPKAIPRKPWILPVYSKHPKSTKNKYTIKSIRKYVKLFFLLKFD